MRNVLPDLLLVGGIACIVRGVALWSPASAAILAGVAAIALGIVGAMGRENA
jgi:hypothetical protein